MSQPAAVITAIDGPIEIVDIEIDAPRDGEALVEILAAGVCGSDASLRRGGMRNPLPLILGHEAVGVVRELGPGTSGPEVGTRVTLWMRPPCRTCPACIRGEAGLCQSSGRMSATGTLLDGRTSSTWKGEPLYRALGVGAFTTRVVMPVNGLAPVPDDVPDGVAALLGCGVATGAGSVLNVAKPRPGDNVLVIGAGGVGLAAAMMAAAMGAGSIVVVDPAQHRREAALELGATHAIEGGDKEALRDQLAEALGQAAVDIVIEAVGKAELIELAYRTVRPGGLVVAVGVPSLETQVTLPALHVATSHKRIAGCFMGGIDLHRDLPVLFDLFRRGALPVDRLIGATRPLDQVGAALDDLVEAKGLRTVISPGA